MFSGRMLKLIDYLKDNNETTYKELTMELEIKERYLRYDIDRINDFLELNKMPLIEKRSKGLIIFPKYINVLKLTEKNDFIYSQEERSALILLILLIDNKNLKINKLSQDFQVSRSTIKNNMSLVEQSLSKESIKITYTEHFFLEETKNTSVSLLNNELKKYVSLLKDKKINLNPFQIYAVDVMERGFSGVDLKQVIRWTDEFLEDMNCVLTDNSYKWYVSNILVLIWFVLNNKEYPLELTDISSVKAYSYDNSIKKLENIIYKEFDDKKYKVIVRLLNYINNDAELDGDIDFIHIETIVSKLILCMSKEMNIDFQRDTILVQGLLSHIVPLIKRVNESINICDEVFSILSDEDIEIFKIVSKVIKDIEGLKDINNDDELTYLAVHFIASRKRIKKSSYMRILLVCGQGYATTTMLKETLLNEYQVIVVDIIPVYKLVNYNKWNHIDYVISTTKLNGLINKDYIVVNPILTYDDCLKIERLGIPRKTVLTNYYSIKEKLDFLNYEDRIKVLEVIKKEFGYENIKVPLKINKLSDLLTPDRIKLIDKKITWKEVVDEVTTLLEQSGFIDKRYKEDIIYTLETVGFYCVTDGYFALLHGKDTEGVMGSGISLIVSKEYIEFGQKKVKVVFCLSSKDKKEHIPAVICLMRMIKNTQLIEKLENAEALDEIKDILFKCELEVML